MKKKIISVTITVLLLLFMAGLAAAEMDSAGNGFFSDDSPAEQTIGRDLYWIGMTRVFNGYQVGKSFIAAGRDITVSESQIGGSLRAGAYSITLNGVDIEDNITAAGYSLQMSGVTASGVYLAGFTVYFGGTADCVNMAGNTVTLDGEIHGDANIYADKIVLGDNLQVDGKLTVHSENEPSLPSNAKIGTYEFNETKAAEETIIVEETGKTIVVTNKPADETNKPVDETGVAADGTNTPADEPKKPVDVSISVEKKVETNNSSGFGNFIRGMFGTLLLAALICLLLGDQEMRKPGKMLLDRPFPMLGSGFAALFVLPGVILILLFIGIGFPSAGLLAILFMVTCLYARSFAGATLANALLPKFTDNKILNNVWVSSMIGALVFWLLRKIPVFGFILQTASLLYALGYFVQCIFLRFRKNKPESEGSLPPKKDVLEPAGMNKPAVMTGDIHPENQETEITIPAEAVPAAPEISSEAPIEAPAKSDPSETVTGSDADFAD